MALTIKNPFNKKKYEVKVATNTNEMMASMLDKGAIQPNQMQTIINMVTKAQLKSIVKQMKKEGKSINAQDIVAALKKSMGEGGLALWYRIGNTDKYMEVIAQEAIDKVCGK